MSASDRYTTLNDYYENVINTENEIQLLKELDDIYKSVIESSDVFGNGDVDIQKSPIFFEKIAKFSLWLNDAGSNKNVKELENLFLLNSIKTGNAIANIKGIVSLGGDEPRTSESQLSLSSYKSFSLSKSANLFLLDSIYKNATNLLEKTYSPNNENALFATSSRSRPKSFLTNEKMGIKTKEQEVDSTDPIVKVSLMSQIVSFAKSNKTFTMGEGLFNNYSNVNQNERPTNIDDDEFHLDAARQNAIKQIEIMKTLYGISQNKSTNIPQIDGNENIPFENIIVNLPLSFNTRLVKNKNTLLLAESIYKDAQRVYSILYNTSTNIPTIFKSGFANGNANGTISLVDFPSTVHVFPISKTNSSITLIDSTLYKSSLQGTTIKVTIPKKSINIPNGVNCSSEIASVDLVQLPAVPRACPVTKIKNAFYVDSVYKKCLKVHYSQFVTQGNNPNISRKGRISQILSSGSLGGKVVFIKNGDANGQRPGQPGGIVPRLRNKF